MTAGKRRTARHHVFALLLAIAAASTTACTAVRLVADYQQASLDEALRLGKQVDLFYLSVIERPQRPYAPFAERYMAIESELGGLLLREKARPLNAESARISQIILDFWRAYKARHQKTDAYPDARFDRRRFARLFEAAVSAEAAKRLGSADTAAPTADSSSTNN